MTQSEGEKKKVILTCAQPTGKLTLGNYLGAVRNWSNMLENHECYFGIVDLHAITTPAHPFFRLTSKIRSSGLSSRTA